MGVAAGTSLTADYASFFSSYLGYSQSRSSGSRGLIVGPMLEFRLPRNIFLEVDGLYRELHYTETNGQPDGSKFTATYPTITWELPVLAKYKFSVPVLRSNVRPFLEAGPSFRLTGNLNTNPSHYGVTGGVGVEFRWQRLNIAPVVRYTRWAPDAGFGGFRSKTDQLEFLVGFSDAAGTNLHPLGRHFSIGGVVGAGWTNVFGSWSSPNYTSYPPSGPPDGAFISEGSPSVMVGPLVEFELLKHLSVEVDALRWRLHSSTALAVANGTTSPEFTTNYPAWEFPILAKYRFAPAFSALAKPKPFLELGPSFRLIEGQGSGTSVGAYGITAGAGLEWKLGALRIAPTIRYTRWGGQNYPVGFTSSLSPNQAALLVGFSF